LRECRRQLEEAKASRPDDRVFEKRLLEDKYRTLKDKYVRLKADVKQSLEKRNKKRLAVENNRAGGTTGSETDRSTSQKHNIEKAAKKLPPTEETAQESIIEASEANNNNNIDTHTSSNKESLIISPPPTDSSDRMSPPPVLPRRGRRHPSKLKSSSTPRLDRTTANPVENLRTQLKKLEDLEDLFPASTHTDTYLRYPFSDSGIYNYSNLFLKIFTYYFAM
jgi:centrosomal protein CEP164